MIDSFSGEHRFLSNFYPSFLSFGKLVFQTVEHGYQAAKSLNQEDWFTIANLVTPGEAKRVGQKLTLRPDWETYKLEAMQDLLRMKFNIPHLKEKLIATGNQELIEGNHWGDTYWGICQGKGQNHLGKLLMKIRSEL